MAKKKKDITENVDAQVEKNDLLNSIVQKFGDALVPGEEKVEAITTGSLALDVSIGVGGFPRGRFTVIYGPEGVAKTTMALCASKSVLENGGRVLYVDAETMLSYSTIEMMLGVSFDPERFILIHPETGEQAFELCEEVINANAVDLIVIDTVAALEPEAEKEKELNESTMMETSRLLSKFFRRNGQAVKKQNIAFLFLNQIRDNTKSYMGGYDLPSGHALKHHASVIVALTKGQAMKVGSDTVGVKAKFVVKKNKLAPPFRSFTIPITFGKGIDYYMDLLEFCEMLGVVSKGGSYYKFEDETIGQGKFAASEFLEKNKEVRDKIIAQTYAVIKGTKGIDIDSLEESFVDDLDTEE